MKFSVATSKSHQLNYPKILRKCFYNDIMNNSPDSIQMHDNFPKQNSHDASNVQQFWNNDRVIRCCS